MISNGHQKPGGDHKAAHEEGMIPAFASSHGSSCSNTLNSSSVPSVTIGRGTLHGDDVGESKRLITY